MKSIISIAALIAMTTMAAAQSTTAKVPTGIDVRGPADYRLEGSQVVHIADRCNTGGLRRGLCERASTKNGNRESSADAAAGNAGLK